jgi:signal transduction histidine kinase
MRQSLDNLKNLTSSGHVEFSSVKSHLAYLEQGQKQLESLTEQLHQISIVAEYEENEVDMTELLRYVVTQIPFSKYQPFQLITDIQPDLTILGDAQLLQQMLMELCINAVESMPEGGKLKITAMRVDLDKSQALRKPFLSPGPNLLITISDSGAGMSPEACRRVFDPFFSTKAPMEGSGLGLMKVYQIVKSHLGHIELESKLGQGTTVLVHLPLPVPSSH